MARMLRDQSLRLPAPRPQINNILAPNRVASTPSTVGVARAKSSPKSLPRSRPAVAYLFQCTVHKLIYVAAIGSSQKVHKFHK
jgi:hypothetical protein